ncbi:1,4-alpha-glucan branching protein GlgB [Clostridium beijerinckii]|uniref:1,4-alpha-glucan branching protein GlgB n=1 Tax=Clostridium beijerinckii TaxID=1520 RepID=UPI002431AD99|nr:1,4-alpha-glucan branching protein GlgB [Clostridium beijerinckii]MDG5856965.1 1,4-alpha-glucan branching protein GlgB [Clostridium beijerinckii]
MQNDPKSSKIKDKDEIGPRDMNGLTEEDGKVSIEDNSSVEKRISKTKGRAKKKISSKETTELNPINNLDVKVKDITTNDKEIGIKSKGILKKSKAIDKKNALENKNEEKIILKEENNKESELENGGKINKSKSTKANESAVQSKTKKTTSKSSKGKSAVTSTQTSTRKKSASKKLMEEFQAEGEKVEKSKTEHIKSNVKKRTESMDKSEITNFNTYLFHQGKNYESYNILGSHIKTEKRKKGVQFVTWAPNAKDVYVVGDFNNFEVKEEYRLERITENGLWKGFFYTAKAGNRYKYCIVESDGEMGEYKADPYAIQSELRPDNASIVYKPKAFKWNDKKWIDQRNKINVLEQPLNIYEIHLGSWKTNKDGGFLKYEEIAEDLPEYVKDMGYTHVELMPLIEHPLDASWGYQGTGYYSPTSRYGDYEGLKILINKLHEANIGVIMDWVPGHFCKDAHGLYKFDGTPTYEYQEEWRAENKGWGTCNFDLGRDEVKSYLISNALYWYREFHIDGLRVDAVSSILYLDYSRSHGEWVPNKYGGNGNLEAIDFLKELNKAVFAEYPTALMIAEESTSWPNVTKPTIYDGLGFNLKWNMGWMNDTLEYVEIDPKYRKHNHKNITFAMMYNYAENYLLPLSHDEVVHGKKSLVNKMWGDEWNKFAGLRAFMCYMMGHPGKKLSFMGCEFAQKIEWREYEELKWNLIDELEIHKKTQLFFKDLNNLYLNNKAFWELDHDYRGFNWIEADNNEQSILIFARRSRNDKDTLIFIINFTSIVYYDYQIGVPFLGSYEEVFNSDDSKYGGSGQIMGEMLVSEKTQFHNQPYSLKVKVPPMATLILKVNEINVDQEIKEKDE